IGDGLDLAFCRSIEASCFAFRVLEFINFQVANARFRAQEGECDPPTIELSMELNFSRERVKRRLSPDPRRAQYNLIIAAGSNSTNRGFQFPNRNGPAAIPAGRVRDGHHRPGSEGRLARTRAGSAMSLSSSGPHFTAHRLPRKD